LGAADGVHLATKVRLMPEHLGDIGKCVRESVAGSLRRLRVDRVALLQLHNSVTARAGDQPTSITPGHVLDSGGVLEAMARLQQDGLVQHLGLTGLGEPAAMRTVIESGKFATIQIPYNLLNPSAGQLVGADWDEADYGNVIADCARMRMGVFAIRVFEGGALVGKTPSAHTLTTKFFPLDLYERDRARAARMAETLPKGLTLKEAALRFVLAHPQITSAIVGFADPAEVSEAVKVATAKGKR
jgi:aryl-alcohol dehydrogenase-like predicted oxidoreductase